jgi:hypothetical protein
MSDYSKMLLHIESALKSLEAAENNMLPVNAVKQLDAYLLAYIRCTKTCLAETKKAIVSSVSYRKTKKRDEDSKTE